MHCVTAHLARNALQPVMLLYQVFSRRELDWPRAGLYAQRCMVLQFEPFHFSLVSVMCFLRLQEQSDPSSALLVFEQCFLAFEPELGKVLSVTTSLLSFRVLDGTTCHCRLSCWSLVDFKKTHHSNSLRKLIVCLASLVQHCLASCLGNQSLLFWKQGKWELNAYLGVNQ